MFSKFYDLKDLNLKLKPFDLKLISNLEINHPFQKIMLIIYNYYQNYQTGGDDEDGVENDWIVELNNDVLKDVDYFKILDNFYRDGIGFDNENIFPGNILCVTDSHLDNETEPSLHIIEHYYDSETLIKYDVKTINISDCDTGETTLSEIKKWKRKVINEEQNKKTKIRLLNPTIYHSIITFYIFSNFKSRSNNQFNYYISDGINKVSKKLNTNKYRHIKKYESKISNKIFIKNPSKRDFPFEK